MAPSTPRRVSLSQRFLLASALVASLLQASCDSRGTVGGRVAIEDVGPQGLMLAELLSMNGTYGAGCHGHDDGDPWSALIDSGATPMHDLLSVLVDDVGCVLTLTEIVTTSGVRSAMPAIALTGSFNASASAFGPAPSSIEFYANARLSSVTYASDFVITLSYSADPDLVPNDNEARPVPEVVASTPLNGAAARSIATRPTVTFNTPMDPATLTTLTFTVTEMGEVTPVPGVVAYDAPSRTATFTPTASLELSTTYQVRVTTGAESVGEQGLAANYDGTFSTAAVSQGRVTLGQAEAFTVLSGGTLASTGLTVITGQAGATTNPATGFPPGTTTPPTILYGAAVSDAIVDLAAAADEVGARPAPTALSGDIGGMTLAPGLYQLSGAPAIVSANLTLDANGEADAVFVLRATENFAVGASRTISLIDGAKASNVYWVFEGQVVAGMASTLVGTYIATDPILLMTNASVTGRLLSLDDVSLSANAVAPGPP